jgi:hypothetical protein
MTPTAMPEPARAQFARKLIWTILAAVALAGATLKVADDTGKEYVDQALTQALVTFALARTLNGVISVAQGTEIAVEPAGVGVNFTVGQILDPINDLVERFSSVMLVATSSIGLQSLLLRMTGAWGVSVALAIAVAIALISLWTTRFAWLSESAAIRLLLIMIAFRFAVPVFVICTHFVSAAFLLEQQSAAVEALDATRVEVEEFNEEAAQSSDAQRSLLEQLGSALSSTLDSINFRDRIEQLRERLSNATEHIVNLIVIFVTQTILLPIGFLWLFVGLLKSLAARTAKF